MSRRIPQLTTARLNIRELSMDDLPEANRILNEAFGSQAPLEARAPWLQWTRLGYEQFSALAQPPLGERAVVLRTTGELVGIIGIVPYLFPFGLFPQFGRRPASRNSAEIGLFWATDPARQRKGYATEAVRGVIDYLFHTENLGRVIATTDYDNFASQAVMRKAGMAVSENPFRDPPWAQVLGVLENP